MKPPFVFRVQSERQNNYTTMQQGPECATMTRELCLEAENTYTPEMEGFFFSFFLVDEHKVHNPFGQTGRNNKVHREKAETKTEKKNRAMKY